MKVNLNLAKLSLTAKKPSAAAHHHNPRNNLTAQPRWCFVSRGAREVKIIVFLVRPSARSHHERERGQLTHRQPMINLSPERIQKIMTQVSALPADQAH